MDPIELEQHLTVKLEEVAPFEAIELMCGAASAEYLVWWACLCGWSTWRPAPPSREDQSLSIASCWIFTGDEQLRNQAISRSELSDAGSCKWLLKAVAYSGAGSAVVGQSPVVHAPDTVGRFILGFIHELLSIHPTVQRTAVAQTFTQMARQAITEPLPRVATVQGELVTS